jgi:hypothetical protein
MADSPAQPHADRSATGRVGALLLVAAIALLVPIALRPASARLTAGAPPSYLPSLEPTRVRRPFDPTFREDLRRIRPEYVLIGDSMLGSRIDPSHLSRTIGRQAWWVMQPGTGSAYWYLALKNVVLGAGLKPKVVFVFFRDYNLTDVLFRLDEQFRWSVDTLAGPFEPELDRAIARRLEGPWYVVPKALDAAYGYRAVRDAADVAARRWPALAVAGPLADDVQKHLNAAFALDKLRPALAADIASGDDTLGDFDRMRARSILPEMVALARANGIRLCFVRVQRRPGPAGPPVQSPVLRRYVADLERDVESSGNVFRDDTGDPDYPLAWYSDGDHTAGRLRKRYTELFVQKLADLFR